MKKALVFLFIAAAVFGFSCKSAPTLSGVSIDGEVTQDKVNDALNRIYDTYFSKLDLSGAGEYTIKQGDTLSAITRNFYSSLSGVGTAGQGNGFYFPLLLLASNHAIVDPDLIEPGMKLVIPDLQKNLANPVSRKAIKDCIKDVSYVYNRKGRSADEQGLIALSDSL